MVRKAGGSRRGPLCPAVAPLPLSDGREDEGQPLRGTQGTPWVHSGASPGLAREVWGWAWVAVSALCPRGSKHIQSHMLAPPFPLGRDCLLRLPFPHGTSLGSGRWPLPPEAGTDSPSFETLSQWTPAHTPWALVLCRRDGDSAWFQWDPGQGLAPLLPGCWCRLPCLQPLAFSSQSTTLPACHLCFCQN